MGDSPDNADRQATLADALVALRLADGRDVVGLNRVDGDLIAPEQFTELMR